MSCHQTSTLLSSAEARLCRGNTGPPQGACLPLTTSVHAPSEATAHPGGTQVSDAAPPPWRRMAELTRRSEAAALILQLPKMALSGEADDRAAKDEGRQPFEPAQCSMLARSHCSPRPPRTRQCTLHSLLPPACQRAAGRRACCPAHQSKCSRTGVQHRTLGGRAPALRGINSCPGCYWTLSTGGCTDALPGPLTAAHCTTLVLPCPPAFLSPAHLAAAHLVAHALSHVWVDGDGLRQVPAAARGRRSPVGSILA